MIERRRSLALGPCGSHDQAVGSFWGAGFNTLTARLAASIKADTEARALRSSCDPAVGCLWGAGVDNLVARDDYLEFEARLEAEEEAHASRGGRKPRYS